VDGFFIVQSLSEDEGDFSWVNFGFYKTNQFQRRQSFISAGASGEFGAGLGYANNSVTTREGLVTGVRVWLRPWKG
jgi:hypothetical protein